MPLWLALDDGGYDLIVRQEAGLAAWWLLALGVAFGLIPMARPPREVRLAAAAFASLCAVTALGLFGTESHGRTVSELGRLLAYAGLLTLAGLALRRDRWRAAAAGLSAAAVLVPGIALASRLAPDLFEGLVAPELLGASRLAYPLGYWNAVASWCAIGFAVGLSASAHARRTAVRSLALAALPLSGCALYLTYSRAGWISLAIGIAVVVVAGRHRATVGVHAAGALGATGAVILVVRSQPAIADGTGAEGGWLVAAVVAAACLACGRLPQWTRTVRLDRRRLGGPSSPRVRAAAAAAAAVAVVAVLALGARVAGTSEEAFQGYAQADEDPAARLVDFDGSRGELWRSALGAFASEPATGIGAGSFQLWWERDVDDGEPVRDAHSLYLETLAETGVPGLVALLAVVGSLLLACIRARRIAATPGAVGATAGLTAAFVIFVFHAGVDWVWDFTALAVLGLGAALVLGATRAHPLPIRRRLGWRRAAVVTAAVIAGASLIPGTVSENRARAAEEVLLAGLTERAAELADDAVAAAPWDAEPYALRAYVALVRHDLEPARTDARSAIDREPSNWRHHLLLARIEIEAGDELAAEAALDEVVRLRPAAAPDVDRLRQRVGLLQSVAAPALQTTAPRAR